MKTAEKKKVRILVIVTAILAVSLYLNYFSPVQPSNVNPAPRRVTAQSNMGPLPSYDLLVKNRVQIVSVKRNIFDFENVSDDLLAGSLAGVSEPSEPPVPEPPVIPNVRYLGFYFEKENMKQRYAAISNTGKVAVGREGEFILSGRYQVLRIEPEYVLLRVASEDKTLHLPLGRRTGRFVKEE